ncbi:MAG: DNA mismatch repair endonuclease MutL [Gemmatimonadetes bacterium]|nr:DNA mismatch repair endonuclease MutL [Gemmatimonadota bacterium]
MPRRIHILPDTVANQIAAGEVVERPASVAKELVENALDAGASRVDILMEGGGKRRIRVSDDGVGMGREDALLSLDRHATSKIAHASDLREVTTFGFRGEALPSIAAISRLTLETADGEDAVGTRIRVEGGRIVDVQDFPRQRGTTVEVWNLFYNVPARAKFLKSASAETRAVSDAVIQLALAHSSVAFHLSSDGRTLLELPAASDVAARIAAIWGEEEAGRLLPCQAGDGDAEVWGLAQRPDAARPGFRRVHLFVNGRPFRAPHLLRAADRAYRTTVAPAVRPWFFLYLRLPPGAVDVNVHPTKAEVKFRQPERVEGLVEDAVRRALAGAASAATLDTRAAPPRLAAPERGAQQGAPAGMGRAAAPPPQMALFFSGETAPAEPLEACETTLPEPSPARLWQLHQTYVLAETRQGLLIVDQHSAHERILFERMMRDFASGGAASQRLLFPITVRLSPGEHRVVEEMQSLLARAGFEVSGFGGSTVIVHAVPHPHPYFDAERCFREMIGELTRGSELVRSARNQHERIAMTFACKGAIKAGQRLDERELHELFDQLFATELPYHDVHGRPTVVRLSREELERKFGR